MDSRSPTPDLGGPRERLPNLFEVLSRRTLAPVDLFSFYIYMRDVQRSVDYLDFWYVSHTIRHPCSNHAILTLLLTWTGSMSPNTCPSAVTTSVNFADPSSSPPPTSKKAQDLSDPRKSSTNSSDTLPNRVRAVR